MQDATLVILLNGQPVSDVLLGYKKSGFGQGKYAGFGGKVERGESMPEAALRELTEETGVTLADPAALKFSSVLEFRFPRKRTWNHRVFVFLTHHWLGMPAEGVEMAPQWFAVEDIPYRQMWDDAHYWLPLVISREQFQARFRFMADNETVDIVRFSPLSL